VLGSGSWRPADPQVLMVCTAEACPAHLSNPASYRAAAEDALVSLTPLFAPLKMLSRSSRGGGAPKSLAARRCSNGSRVARVLSPTTPERREALRARWRVDGSRGGRGTRGVARLLVWRRERRMRGACFHSRRGGTHFCVPGCRSAAGGLPPLTALLCPAL
jgi:hypothetical protein